jgi:hypothetical protein
MALGLTVFADNRGAALSRVWTCRSLITPSDAWFERFWEFYQQGVEGFCILQQVTLACQR